MYEIKVKNVSSITFYFYHSKLILIHVTIIIIRHLSHQFASIIISINEKKFINIRQSKNNVNKPYIKVVDSKEFISNDLLYIKCSISIFSSNFEDIYLFIFDFCFMSVSLISTFDDMDSRTSS